MVVRQCGDTNSGSYEGGGDSKAISPNPGEIEASSNLMMGCYAPFELFFLYIF